MPGTIDLEALGFDSGAHLLIDHALRSLAVGDTLVVRGNDPALGLHLRAWCRRHGHQSEVIETDSPQRFEAHLTKGVSGPSRWQDAERAGGPTPTGVVERAEPYWGLAARGALVETGGPASDFDLDHRATVWADLAPRLYAQAAASQWDPAAAVDWHSPVPAQPEVEAAVVQIMTYLVENEQAALAVPARFLGRIHPHFREVVQFLAIQVADEARHVDVFARRAGLHGSLPGTSSVAGRESLSTLFAEQEFARASFLLSVMGEGTFLNLLSFLEVHGPDPVTREITRLARQDETRHVAFAMNHLEYQIERDSALLDRLKSAIEQRYEALRDTSGLNEDVFDALALLAAGSWEPKAIERGYAAVRQLEREMAEGRERRLIRLGYSPADAASLAQLHTKNFM